MKKKITAALLAVEIMLIMGFGLLNGRIRALLCPRAATVFPEHVMENGGMYLCLPEGALQYDAEGRTFVYTVVISRRYKEPSYVAKKVEVDVVWIDGKQYIDLMKHSELSRVVIDEGGRIEDGMRVVPIEKEK